MFFFSFLIIPLYHIGKERGNKYRQSLRYSSVFGKFFCQDNIIAFEILVTKHELTFMATFIS